NRRASMHAAVIRVTSRCALVRAAYSGAITAANDLARFQAARALPRPLSGGHMPKKASDITGQFFTAGDLMELNAEADSFADLDQARGEMSPSMRGWLFVAAASALGLLVLVVLAM